ncbi:Ig-like domain-containing protein [Propionibacterium sp.]|uniref:L,D-transpeptidase n=1 Tax=Propionibacterium sp. TaxID=1977903 RepID=UPI0039E88AA9
MPDDPLVVTVTDGTLQSVTLTDSNGDVYKGDLSGNTWTGERTFWPNKSYTVTAQVLDHSKAPTTLTKTFTTKATDTNVYEPNYTASPLGIGMPVYIQFHSPVTDQALRAAIEKHGTVTTTPQQAGSWGWVDNKILMWRPQNYWQPGSKVDVKLEFGGLKADDGVYLADDTSYSLTYGESHVMRVDLTTQHMTLAQSGNQIRDFKVSTGEAGHETYTGTKVIMEKFASMVMDSGTFGVPATAPGGYKLQVADCQRLTWSGEFLHAAPWSVSDQGVRPVSHGCTNLSPDDAKWLIDFTLIGDPVEFSGNFPGTSSIAFTPDDGVGCWTYDWNAWQKQSALA